MTAALIRRREETQIKTHRGKTPYEDKGRDETYVDTSQGTFGDTGS